MQQIKKILTTIIASGFTFFLFFVGLGFMLAVFIIMLLVGLLVKPSTRKQWRERWNDNWHTRHAAHHQGCNQQRQTRVIEGEYVVKSH